ncbi:MAG: DUF6390 family protein [Actinomycetota bacterium]
MTGALRFCRYAYPPNALGYCGPDDALAVFEHTAAGVADAGLVSLVRGFEGAWPYLQLIAAANGIEDPLDDRVVQAYWVGNRLLGAVDEPTLGRFVEDRFRARMGKRWSALSDRGLNGSVPHHNFHVFVVYPWIGMLRHGFMVEPLRVLDRCRIRRGVVEEVIDDSIRVTSRPLTYDGGAIGLGTPIVETASASIGGVGFIERLRPGDEVSLHWDWVCERLQPRDIRALDRCTSMALEAANDVLRLAPASTLR